MSKTSYALIAIMAAALLYMGAARVYQVYERKVAEREAAAVSSFSFQNVPVSLAAPQAEPVSYPVAFEPAPEDVYLEDVPLTAEQKIQQAQDTIVSILDDYKDDPNLQQFNRALSQATQGKVDNLGVLSGDGLAQILQENPQVGQVVAESMKNPEFAKTVQQIFTNPQFIESVKQLQGADLQKNVKKQGKI